jgi:phosphatidate cytidylyltransferase
MPPKRVLTALVGIPLFFLLVLQGSPYLFFLSVLIIALMGQNEFYSLLEGEDTRLQKFTGLLMGALILRGFYYEDFTLILRSIVFSLLLLLVLRTLSRRDVTHAVKEIAVVFFGIFYVCFLLGYLILLRGREHDGQAWIFFLFFAVWAGDTGAYYLGRRFGKHKLYPRISPNKTLEGAAGGLFCSLAASVVGKVLLFPEYSLLHIVLLGGALGVVGQIGDLSESLLKRSSGAKDSGLIFPGHGGVLDRFDSILFASPVLYYVVWLGAF